MAPFDLSGRVALVTGAGAADGIGFATARLLGRCGATVVLAGLSDRVRDRAGELAAEGLHATTGVGDLTAPDEADSLVGRILDERGRLDIVVNNAGMTAASHPAAPSAPFDAVAPAEWDAVIARNLGSAANVVRAALPHLRDAGFGRIVNVASVTGPVMAMAGEAAYAAAKAGMVGLTRALAVECAPHGITVNAVAPGWVATGSQTDHEAAQGRRTPIGRSATPEEVAAPIVWLSTVEASYVTGTVLVVDGANSVAEERA